MTLYEVEMDDLSNKKKQVSTPGMEQSSPTAASQDSTQQIWSLTVAGVYATVPESLDIPNNILQISISEPSITVLPPFLAVPIQRR